MRHLTIRNVGPLRDVDIKLKRINIVIGPQSSGKSCLLKIACHCAWVEKRIELEQTVERFKEKGAFITQLELFHNMKGYCGDESYIKYETDFMSFSYNGKLKKFDFNWKEKRRWEYKRTKICYIPAERNIVAILPEQYKIEFGNNNIENFLRDWEYIRRVLSDFKVLSTGVKYHYNPTKKCDEVQVSDSITIQTRYASSGLQSLIPVCGLLQYFFDIQFIKKGKGMIDLKAENIDILKNIYREIFEDRYTKVFSNDLPLQSSIDDMPKIFRIAGYPFVFKDAKDAEDCKKKYNNYIEVSHSDIFLEEPELNLFPITQHDLLNWMIGMSNKKRKHSLFVATHSPYIMTSINNLLEAGKVIAENKNNRESVEKIVTKNSILAIKDVGAYSIEDGMINSIIDKESNLISADKLDEASDIIDRKFNELLWL